jgi:hypothetical protein
MINNSSLDQCFSRYIGNLSEFLPDGVLSVDLQLLEQLQLLHYYPPSQREPELTRFFHLIESPEKITLVNDQFVIWIAPRKGMDGLSTYALIALNRHDQPQLELAFVASGVYNTSQLVLRILEKLLVEIQENEDTLLKLHKK